MARDYRLPPPCPKALAVLDQLDASIARRQVQDVAAGLRRNRVCVKYCRAEAATPLSLFKNTVENTVNKYSQETTPRSHGAESMIIDEPPPGSRTNHCPSVGERIVRACFISTVFDVSGMPRCYIRKARLRNRPSLREKSNPIRGGTPESISLYAKPSTPIGVR